MRKGHEVREGGGLRASRHRRAQRGVVREKLSQLQQDTPQDCDVQAAFWAWAVILVFCSCGSQSLSEYRGSLCEERQTTAAELPWGLVTTQTCSLMYW